MRFRDSCTERHVNQLFTNLLWSTWVLWNCFDRTPCSHFDHGTKKVSHKKRRKDHRQDWDHETGLGIWRQTSGKEGWQECYDEVKIILLRHTLLIFPMNQLLPGVSSKINPLVNKTKRKPMKTSDSNNDLLYSMNFSYF